MPLAVTFPLSGRFRDLHPLEHVRAGRTENGDGICDVIPVIGFRNAIIRQPDGLHP